MLCIQRYKQPQIMPDYCLPIALFFLVPKIGNCPFIFFGIDLRNPSPILETYIFTISPR